MKLEIIIPTVVMLMLTSYSANYFFTQNSRNKAQLVVENNDEISRSDLANVINAATRSGIYINPNGHIAIKSKSAEDMRVSDYLFETLQVAVDSANSVLFKGGIVADELADSIAAAIEQGYSAINDCYAVAIGHALSRNEKEYTIIYKIISTDLFLRYGTEGVPLDKISEACMLYGNPTGLCAKRCVIPEMIDEHTVVIYREDNSPFLHAINGYRVADDGKTLVGFDYQNNCLKIIDISDIRMINRY